MKEGGHRDRCVVGKQGEVDVALVGLYCDFDVVHAGETLAQIRREKSTFRALLTAAVEQLVDKEGDVVHCGARF